MLATPDQITTVAAELHYETFKLAHQTGFTALVNACRYSQAVWKVPLENGSLSVTLLGDGIVTPPSFSQSPLVWADLSLETNDGRNRDYFFGSWFMGEQAVIDSRSGKDSGRSRNVHDLLVCARVKTIRDMAQLIIQGTVTSKDKEISKYVRVGGLEPTDNGLSVAAERHVRVKSGKRTTSLVIDVAGNELDPISFNASMREVSAGKLELIESRFHAANIGKKAAEEIAGELCETTGLDITVEQLEGVKRQGRLALENAANRMRNQA